MKKISLAVIAALVLLYPAIVWLMGYAVEGRMDDTLDQIRRQAPYLTVVERHFRRGWYSSQVDVTFEAFRDVRGVLPGASGMGKLSAAPLRVTVRSVVHHGPICGMHCLGLAGIESRFVFSGPVRSVLSQVYGSTEPVTIHSRLGFFGGGTTTISSPSFKDKSLADGARLGWGGLVATFTYGRDYDSIALRATAPRAMFTGMDGKRLEVAGVSLDTHSKRALRTLYEGDGLLTVDRLDFSAGRLAGVATTSTVPPGTASPGTVAAGAVPTGTITINDLRSESSTRADKGLMTVSMRIGTGAITTAPLALIGLHYDFSFRHLDMESLETLTAALRESNRDTSLTLLARTGKMLAMLKQQGAPLLLHQPELAIDRISISTATGGALLSGAVRLNGAVPADFATGADPRATLRKLDVNMDLALDDTFLASLPGGGATLSAQLQPLVDQGLLSHDNGRFHTKFQFRQGSATFNGKSFRPGGVPSSQRQPPGPLPH